MRASVDRSTALNAICPYFTMFPLHFPLTILKRARPGDIVLDPFCGRGTTNFAARLLGLSSVGIDSNPVAAAVTEAKLAAPTPEAVVREAEAILARHAPRHVPTGDFWKLAYHPHTLTELCALRDALVEDCESDARKALRGLLLGALHGPRRVDGSTSYLSNQAPRTYAPKPRYAVQFWLSRSSQPPRVDVIETIKPRALRFYRAAPASVPSKVSRADSRLPESLQRHLTSSRANWIVTSPPYYGLRTYGPDQWLRSWFLGGANDVDYTMNEQVSHAGPQAFIADLRRVWMNVADVAASGARMVIRFGSINDRKADPLQLIRSSLSETPWQLQTRVPAGSAHCGKRQASSFRVTTRAATESDIWVRMP